MNQNSNLRFISVFTLICMFFMCISAFPFETYTYAASALPANTPVITTKDGYALFEAENMSYKASVYSIVDDKNAGAGKAFFAGSSTGLDLALENCSHFTIKPDADGEYSVWLRVSPNSSSKSSYVSLNGGAFYTASFAGEQRIYNWYSIATNKQWKKDQEYTFSLIPSNGYYNIDRVLVIKDIGWFEPTGIDATLQKVDTRVPTNKYNAPTFTPPPEHPRLYFRKKDIPQIVANFTKTENMPAYSAHQNNLKIYTDGILERPEEGASNHINKYLGYFESWAFEYAITGNETYGRQAIDSLRNYMNTVVFIDPNNDGYTRNAGHLLFTVAEIYDWCYPLLSEEEKTFFIEKSILIIKGGIEVGWPPVRQGALTGHGSEAQTLRDMLSFSIAIYDERPDVYTLVAGRFFDEFLPARQYHYKGGFFHQGTGYGSYRGQWDYNATWIFSRMGLDNVFGPDQHKAAYWFGYMLRPDGLPFSDGDVNLNGRTPGTPYSGFRRVLFFAANYYKDPYLKFMAQQEGMGSLSYGHGNTSPVEFLVFNDPSLIAVSNESLPRTKYFPSPAGNMMARTGWAENINSNDVLAYMKIGEQWFANHHHLDSGHFQLYYKGILASDSGRYESYGTSHDTAYHKRTIAHNTMLIYDPNEIVSYYGNVNDGGQRIPGGEKPTVDALLADNYAFGKVEGYAFGPDAQKPLYSYLSGDITNAYSSEKMSDFDRSFMFYNLNNDTHPAALIVFDRVISTKPELKKTWLLHGVNMPEVNGNRTVFKNYSETMGYNGKLTVDTLLPKENDTKISIVGGLNNEFYVNGINYPSITKTGEESVPLDQNKSHESDGYRIEVSPKTARTTDYFLNVLQVGTCVPDTEPLTATLYESITHAGVLFADRFCLFSKNDGRTDSNVYFSVEKAGDYMFNIADLKAGVWTVICGTTTIGKYNVTDESGLLTFNGKNGDYTLVFSGATYTNPDLPITLEKTSKTTDSDGNITITAKVKGTNPNATVMVAVYDNKKKMIYYNECDYEGAKDYKFTLDKNADYSGLEARVMVWSGMSEAVPLSNVSIITL